MSRTALVTGASGFVGRYLVSALREAGWKVRTLDRHPPADIVGDLSVLPLRGLRAGVVFHLAAFANPSASLGAAEEAYAANAEATGRLVRDVRAGRLVLASSCQVYGTEASRATEDLLPAPANPYAASKLCGEALARAAGRDVVILRPFNHTGPGQSDQFVCPRIARRIARAEAGLEPPRLEMGDLSPRRDFFDVRDMVRAYLLAAERGRAGEIYNVATGRPVSIGGIVRALVARAKIPLEIQSRKGSGSTLSGDPSKFQKATGWRPRIPFSRTLSDLLAHERSAVR